LMSFLAAFLEAFWSSNAAIEPMIKYIVGISFWIFCLLYFRFMGLNRATG
jgi:undecaprenyl pyrophosphate phosphatase UppP